MCLCARTCLQRPDDTIGVVLQVPPIPCLFVFVLFFRAVGFFFFFFSIFGFLRQGFSVALEPVLKLALVDQAGLELRDLPASAS